VKAIRTADAWILEHQRVLIAAVVVSAAALRALLAIYSPTPFGYVWDFYADGIQVIYREGRLPLPDDCWVCAHPPLFFLAGVPFYAFGLFVSGGSESMGLRWTGALSLISAGVTIYFGYRLLRLFRCRGTTLVLTTALLAVFPCLFISSYGAEADIMLTALLSAFVYYLTRAAARPRLTSTVDAIRLGLIAGAAAATKASGLAALLTLGLVVAAALVFRRGNRIRTLQLAAAVAVAALPLGSWKYLSDWRTYGTPFHARGPATLGFGVGDRTDQGKHYEFFTFRLAELRRAIGPRIQTGTILTKLDVYRSVPTTLHALAWSDMSMFSVTSRHGSREQPYPWKTIPPNLTLSVILLGFVPTTLAAIGVVASARRVRLWPLLVFGTITIAAYVWWFLPQPAWALKTKYVLFLLPQYALYVAIGLGWLARRISPAAVAMTAALALLVALCYVYDYAFAVGRL
jgi:hypothetical protein